MGFVRKNPSSLHPYYGLSLSLSLVKGSIMSSAMAKTHAASRAKADAFKKEAESALNRFSFFGFAKEGNNQDAAGLYQVSDI